MVAISFFAKIKTVLGAAAALASFSVANPALANSSAAVADVAAPLRSAQSAKPAATGDDEFRRLFSSWKSMEGGNASLAINTTAPTMTGDMPAASLSAVLRPNTVSIPSLIPVAGAKLTSGYGMRNHPVLGGRRQHQGIDLSQPTGTPIRATADGVVGRADWFSSYGLFISLEHGGSIETRYGHMSRLNVAAGQVVKKGDIIGYVGSTGRSTGPHLHYEVRIAGVAVNPLPYMQGDVGSSSEVALGGSK
ncbi:M23 family metallopeptidase [Novosphingobium sp.]|uniref:M23 family metallopeptidase n=1 Tax=Novosphingobium sp. TaxID=1874826 RepID=UPI0027342584|nr:M23 family metallopeptidase [Novosphingobium sp.]MDP3906610.1 M23 family metallopeptidase [Novosphingobium sp.]